MPEPPTVPADPLLSDAAPKLTLRERLFRSDFWVAGVVRVLLYVALYKALGSGFGWLTFQWQRPRLSPLDPVLLFWQKAGGMLGAFSAALLLAVMEKRRPGAYGLPLRGAFGKLFWQGVLAGLGEISVLMGLIAAFGGYSFGGLAVRGYELARWGAFWAVLFVLVGLLEEFLFRGYAQFTLSTGFGFWPAAFALSAVFGAAHLANPGEGWVGALSVALVGFLLCLTLRRTGSLWFAVGLHASFDFGETFLYSVPNSGYVARGHLSHATLHGPAWLTGGSVGPEGSLFSFLTMGILFYVLHRLYPPKPEAQQNA